METFGSVGLMEILTVLGVCGLCLLPIAIGGVAAVVILVTRKKPDGTFQSPR
jgi:hypothetical protein